MKKLSILLFFVFTGYLASACDYTVSLFDTYGDGWNGGFLTITVDGSVVLDNIDVPTGNGPNDYDFSASYYILSQY